MMFKRKRNHMKIQMFTMKRCFKTFIEYGFVNKKVL